MIVRMWEVRAYPKDFPALMTWVCDTALPKIEVNPLHIRSEVYASPDHRLVVISKWRGSPEPLADPPAELVMRAPHVWDFTPVDR